MLNVRIEEYFLNGDWTMSYHYVGFLILVGIKIVKIFTLNFKFIQIVILTIKNTCLCFDFKITKLGFCWLQFFYFSSLYPLFREFY